MLASRALGSEHAKEDRHLRVVNRLELDAIGHDEEGGNLLLQLRECTVRNGDPLADSRRLQRLALQENALDLLRGDAIALAEHRCEQRDRLVLVEVGAVCVSDADALRRE